MSRNHVIEVEPNTGLFSLMGGKWTSYRVQGEHTVDKMLEMHEDLANKAKYRDCQTLNFNLVGSYSKTEITDGVKQEPPKLFQSYEDHLVFKYDLPRDIAKNLVKKHGTAAVRVAKLGEEHKLNYRIHEKHPYIAAEVLYAIRSELA